MPPGVPDLFIGTQVYRGRRATSTVSEYSSLVVDLDAYRKGIHSERARELIEARVQAGLLPEPSIWIHSGQGLHVVWLFDPVPATRGTTRLWKACLSFLYAMLSDLGADPLTKHAALLVRADRSINSKNDAQVRWESGCEESRRLESFKHWVSPWLDGQSASGRERRERNVRGPRRECPRRLRSFQTQVISDLATLCELRRGVQRGCREHILFLARNAWTRLGLSHSESEERLHHFIAEHIDDPTSQEVFEWTRTSSSACKKRPRLKGEAQMGYQYRARTMVELLQITEEEQRQLRCLRLRPFGPIAAAAKRTRADLRTETEIRFAERAKQIAQLRAQDPGITYRKIASRTGLSVSSISRTIRDHAELYRQALEKATASKPIDRAVSPCIYTPEAARVRTLAHPHVVVRRPGEGQIQAFGWRQRSGSIRAGP